MGKKAKRERMSGREKNNIIGRWRNKKQIDCAQPFFSPRLLLKRKFQ